MGYPGEGPSSDSSSDSELQFSFGFLSREGSKRRVIVAQAPRSPGPSKVMCALTDDKSGIPQSYREVVQERNALYRASAQATLQASWPSSWNFCPSNIGSGECEPQDEDQK